MHVVIGGDGDDVRNRVGRRLLEYRGVILDLESVGRAHCRFVAELLERRGEFADAPARVGDETDELKTALETWRSVFGTHFRE